MPVPRSLQRAPCWSLLPIQLAASCVFLFLVSRARGTRITWSSQTRRLTGLGVLNPGPAYASG